MPQASNQPRNSDKSSNPPVHTIRYGALRAAIWKREVDLGNNSRPMYSVTFSRSFKDGQNNWKESSSFGFDDLLLLAKAADEAHSWVARQRSVDAESNR
jgi:hypothetical protein